MAKAFWLWYPGDFELYHALQQNFSRVERGFVWPAFWKSEGFRHRIALWRTYDLSAPTTFTVHARGVGFVRLNGREGGPKYRFGEPIPCGPGKVTVIVHIARIEALPSAYVQGDVIRSDDGWLAEDYDRPAVPAGHSQYFTAPHQDPAVWEYSEKEYAPLHVKACQGGYLYEFETELTAALRIQAAPQRLQAMTVYYGESREEALDTEHCYYRWQPDAQGKCPRCAVRFVFIPGDRVELVAVHQYVDFPARASFHCDDERLNRIWAVAEHTFRLCSGIFFIDGVKRDKWIWSGDAYQSFFVNRYLLADRELDQRTLLALRGNAPMTTHINTIVDYSLFWVLGVRDHLAAYGDRAFLQLVWPKAQDLMVFLAQQLDEQGFLLGRPGDWTYLDWADLDKEGPAAGIQMLLAATYDAMAELAVQMGETDAAWRQKAQALRQNIQTQYWNAEKGAFIDSFVSGRRHISRQTNILAVRCGVADAAQRQSIVQNVIHNDSVPPITTPYFNFYQLDMLGACGELDAILAQLHGYWGGMLDRGAVTFWEEFDPTVTGPAQYAMYGDKFGKSLCHAWAASPIYLLARYFVGLRLCGPNRFILEPQLRYFQALDCTLPLCDGSVHLQWDGSTLQISTNCPNGVLRYNGRQYPLSANRLQINAAQLS